MVEEFAGSGGVTEYSESYSVWGLVESEDQIAREKVTSRDDLLTINSLKAAETLSSPTFNDFYIRSDPDADCFVSSDAVVIRLDSSATEQWSSSVSVVSSSVTTGLAVDGSKAVVITEDSASATSYAISDGSENWSVSGTSNNPFSNNFPRGCAIDSSGDIFCGLGSGDIGKLNGSNGSLINSTNHGDNRVQEIAIDTSDNVYVTTDNNSNLFAYSNDLSTERWSKTGDTYDTMAVIGGELAVTSPPSGGAGPDLLFLDTSDGSVSSTLSLPPFDLTSPDPSISPRPGGGFIISDYMQVRRHSSDKSLDFVSRFPFSVVASEPGLPGAFPSEY